MSEPLLVVAAVARGAVFVSLLLLVGAQLAARLVQRTLSPADNTICRTRLQSLARRAVGVLVLGTLIKGTMQVASFTDADTPFSIDLARAVLGSGEWGTAWGAQLAGIVILAAMLLLGRRNNRAALAWATAVLTAWILAFQTGMGHPGGGRWPAGLGHVVDFAHLLGAGIWLGTLGALAVSTFPELKGDDALPSLARIVRAFSLSARVGVTLVLVSGVVAALVYVGPIAQALQSTWGLLLAGKIIVMLGVMTLGWYNWRIVTPALERGHAADRQRLRRAISAELLLGVMMLAITTLLVVSPLPGEQ